MATWFSYGEDPLTYWALRNRLPDVLRQLTDDTVPDDVTVFYRPSFGRGGNTDPTAPRAEFGEFDAILATPKAIYPLEAKWDSSGERQGDTVFIRDVQILRHRVFAWYIARRANTLDRDWAFFLHEADADFRVAFPGKKLAPQESRLARNLEFMLSHLIPISTNVVDVALYLHPESVAPVTRVTPDSFALVNISFVPESDGGIFRL